MESCDRVNNSIELYIRFTGMSTVKKFLFLIGTFFGIIVAYINVCINEAMRRQASNRLAWDQKIEKDQIQTGDNIIRVTLV